MDLINWSLNAIDTIFSTRSLGSGEPDCPDGTFAAGYTMDAWERWRIVCLAALSVEDIEDIYLFGTMITGLLLIGLGFAWVIEEFRKRDQLSKASQGCPSWLKQWEERSALRLKLLTAIWILSWRSSLLCKGKSMVSETRMDKESSRGIGMRLLAPRLNNRNLIFSAPRTSTGLGQGRCWKINPGKSTAVWRSCVPPQFYRHLLLHIHTHTHKNYYRYTHIHTFIHIPTPDPSPPSLWTASLTSGSVTSAGKWLHVWMAACQSWITSPVAKSCVYGVLCAFVAEVFFLFSHCTPQGA